MAQKLVQNACSYLFLRGRTYYFRFALPTPLRRKFPSLPAEVKRSLRTDSYSDALALISKKLPLIRLIQRCSDLESVKSLIGRLVDFSQEFHVWVSDRLKQLQQKTPPSSVQPQTVSPAQSLKPEAKTPKLSKVWSDFVAWKSWPEKSRINNQRLFDNLLFFIGDKPVGEITKQHLRSALNSIAKLPQRNLKPYRNKPLEEIVKMKVPPRYRVSDKYVREHLKVCQSLFSRYMVQEIDLLEKSPTAGLRLETEDSRFGSLTDEQVRLLLDSGKRKQQWFYLVLMLAIYTGARRSEIANLRSGDVRVCPDTGRYYIVIQKGKTKAARRQIPVHHELVKAGLIDWA
ncbi:phage integrase family protein [Marinobacterium halophilum]|uniref:Phage integrase family protein n=1 Tax=Marinobacterium halophilum TaxID=267374 RepID=A0A2P8F130_9GAMM|nr:phage integrase family protein [Marinobacterium halophilum]